MPSVNCPGHSIATIRRLKYFVNFLGTVIILVGLSDGRVMLRSSSSLALLGIVTLDSGPGQQGPGGRVVDSNKTRALWSIKDLGDSHFVAAGDSGYVYLVRLNQSLPDQVTN